MKTAEDKIEVVEHRKAGESKVMEAGGRLELWTLDSGLWTQDYGPRL